MDFLDPNRLKQHRILLRFGYALAAVGIAIACVILLWQAYGYSVKNGKVVQDGMIFISSQPNPASIYINGVLNAATTDTRLTIQAGAYSFKLALNKYRPWQHVIVNLGGQVVHYDYPLLFPNQLSQTKISSFNAAPAFASQSISQQYLLVASVDNFTSFLLFDITNPTNAPTTLTLPAGIVTPSNGAQSWQVIGWADDNQHLLLKHIYGTSSEFIELNISDPTQSININKTFKITPTDVTLNNLKYNQYYFYDATSQTLSSAALNSNNNVLIAVASNVLAFKSYQNNEILYVTANGAPAFQVAVDLLSNNISYLMRDLPAAPTYLLDMAGYSGDDYAVIGDSAYSFVDIYKNPLSQAKVMTNAKILPFRAIRIMQPNYESFAPTAQLIMVENGAAFAVYDIFNDAIYHYQAPLPLDPPQVHARWMDGDRLIYVSGGKITVADFDNTNRQTLSSALAQYRIFFAPDYRSYFTLDTASTSGSIELSQVSLIAQ